MKIFADESHQRGRPVAIDDILKVLLRSMSGILERGGLRKYVDAWSTWRKVETIVQYWRRWLLAYLSGHVRVRRRQDCVERGICFPPLFFLRCAFGRSWLRRRALKQLVEGLLQLLGVLWLHFLELSRQLSVQSAFGQEGSGRSLVSLHPLVRLIATVA